MPQSSHDLVRAFFAAMPAGTLDAGFFTPDFQGTSIVSTPAMASGEFYAGGIRMLQSLFPEGLHYTIDSITAEDDRAAVQLRGEGVMADGNRYANTYAFFFRFRDGKIAESFEFFDPAPVNTLIMPKMADLMAKMQQGQAVT